MAHLVVLAATAVGSAVVLREVGARVPPVRADTVAAWIERPLDPQTIGWSVLVVGWLGWVTFTASVLAYASARLRRYPLWRHLHLRLPGPVQSLHAALLGAAALSSTATPSPTHGAQVPAPATDGHPNPAALSITPTNDAAPSSAGPGENPSRSAAAAGVAARSPAVTLTGAPPAAAPLVRGDRQQELTATVSAVTRRSDADTPSRGRDIPGGTCRVERGDNLWDLAGKHLGDPHRWREIYTLNRDQVQANGYALTDPDEIDVGWVLTLPARQPGQPIDPPGIPPPDTPQPSPPTAQAPSPPASPSSLQAAPSTSASPSASASSHDDSGDGAYAPPSPAAQRTAPSSAAISPSRTASPSAPEPGSASPQTGVDHGDETPSASPPDGVDLPGGWITLGLAGGLLTAVAMVWRRRRHLYKPTPITSARLSDPDLQPPLAAMTRIRTTLRRTAPETLDEQPPSPPTVREYRTAVVKPELPPVGPSGSDLAGAAELPLAAGLGLIGDGALDAARGLLVATLASGNRDDPDAQGRAVIPAATLTTLLNGSAVDLGRLNRLTVTATAADAITQLEEEIIRRSRLIADAQTADVHTWRDNDFTAEPLPQVLLITTVPDPAWTHRLDTAVRLGHSVGIGAVMIGDWPTGTTLTVASDGTTGNDDTPRLTILDTAAAIEMLGMLREAHGDIHSPARPEPPEPLHPPAPAPAEADVVVEPGPGRVDDITTPASPAAASRLPVAVRVLGRPAVLDHDGQPSSGIRSKAIELLVYLAVNRHGADLSDIMEALFPDATLRRAGERLSTVVADLRKHIRQAAATLTPTGTGTGTGQPREPRLEPVPNTGGRYHLDPAIVRVDWWTVLDHYEAAATATDDAQRLSHLTTAIEATGGALAEGAEYDWIDTDREVIRRHRIKLHTHAAALLADTDPHQSWLLLDHACQIDPLSDELARTTMHAAAALGDADAIRHRLTTLRDALDAHGLELSDETDALAQELLRHLCPPPQR